MTAIREQVEKVFSLYEKWGSVQYEGEPVTQLQHALQAAQLAESANAAESTVLAALLHDVGHLVSMGADTEEKWALRNHGLVGKQFLSQHGFPVNVTDVVAGHVTAKRFLVYKYSDYYEKLSSHSRYTLTLQGGAMDPKEAEVFERDPKFSQIIQVRAWDENAKDQHKTTKDLAYYREICEKYLSAFSN